MKKLLLLLISFLMFGTLFANLPCEGDDCQDKCDCEESSGADGGGDSDGSGGNSSSGSGTGGTGVGSVSVWVNWGAPANENIAGSYKFSIYSQKPNPMIYTPQIIQYRNILFDRINVSEVNQSFKTEIRGDQYASETVIGEDNKIVKIYNDGYGQEKLTNSLASDVTHQISIFTNDRKMMIFQFKEGESIGKMIGDTYTKNNFLQMVDSSGNPTTTNPVYYDRYLGQGNFLRYSAETGKVVSYHTAMGRIILPESATVGVEPIYKDGTIRQVWSLGDGLADVVVTEQSVSFEIRCYAPDKVGAKGDDGLYTVNGEPHTIWRIENPDPGKNNQVKVTNTVNGVSEVSLFNYSYNSEGWLLNKPGDLVVESQSTSWDYSRTVKVITTVEKTPDGQVASKVARTYQKFNFGDRMVNTSIDPDGVNLRSQSTYYTDSNNQGSYGRVKTESNSDGSWSSYQYDEQGREIVRISPWKNSPFNSNASQAKAEYKSFTPHVANDIVLTDDIRPRTEETKILGIITSKTYYAYYFDGESYVKVEERCVNQNATYGDETNLRTETRYYPRGNNSSPSAGRIHTIKYPNGTMDTYTYEYGSWSPNVNPVQSTFATGNGAALRVKITHGTVNNPIGIANKTTQDSIVYDTRGCNAYTTQSVYTANGYEQFAWVSNIYNEQRRQTSELKSNGELIEYTWNCCSKESETLADGTQYTYIYDALKRLIVKTKVGIGEQPNLVTTYTYDASGRRTSETITGGDLSSTATWEYNIAGQLLKTVEHQGLITTYAYTQGKNSGSNIKGQTTTIINPGGFTTIQTTFIDGQAQSITGNAQVPQYYDYGINSNGSTWTKINIAGADSPRWQKSTIGMVWETLKSEQSAFNGGTVIQENFYNSKQQLIKSTQTGMADTLYEYDELGNVFRSGLDVNDNGTLDLASNDQIAENETTIDSSWITSIQKVYGTNNSDIATTTSTTKKRLNGFENGIVSESQNIDINGNIIAEKVALDRSNKKMTAIRISPESAVAEEVIVINGLKVSVKSKSNLITTYEYDRLGRVTKATAPRVGATTITYHTVAGKNGLLATITNAAGNVTSFDYNTVTGRKIYDKNALNQYTRYEYDSLGNITKTWGDANYPISFSYDIYGQKSTMTTYRDTMVNFGGTIFPTTTGDVTTWSYDQSSGLVTAKTDASGKSTQYTYDVNGNLLTRTWARGLLTSYLYNNLGKLTKIDYADTTPDITYTYNRLGQQLNIIDAVGTRNLIYDDKFSLLKESINGIYSKELNYGYTTTGLKGKPLNMSLGNVQNYNYGYDTYGRLNQINNINYDYLANSNLLGSVTRPNNINTTWNYESNRNLVASVDSSNLKISYINNAIGNRTSMTLNDEVINYNYNDRSEVTGATSSSDDNYNYAYNFDPIGNRLNATLATNNFSYTTNALNQYTAINTQNPTYDADGNMLNRDGWTQTWNGENRLIQAIKGTQKLEFTYDYMGRRVSKKVYKNDTLTKHTLFVYNEYKLIEELDALNNNATIKTFIWQYDIGLDTPVSMIIDNQTYYYQTDANKNILALTNANGETVASYKYSPFGQITSAIGELATINPFRFSSEYHDTETNLIYYNYRYYDAQLGRWLSCDPIGEYGGINLCAVVKNNIINMFDLLGLVDCCGDKEYDKNKQCCVDEVLKDKFKVCVKVDIDHAWIEATNLYTGTVNTYGRWKKGIRSNGNVKIFKSGVAVNKEKDRKNNGNVKSRCTTVCEYEPTINDGYGISPSDWNPINWIANYLGGSEAAESRYNNCSSYACEEYNRVSGENLSASDFWGAADTPEGLGNSIDEANNPLPYNPNPMPWGPSYPHIHY